MKNLLFMGKVHKFALENKNKERIDPKVDIFLICFSRLVFK